MLGQASLMVFPLFQQPLQWSCTGEQSGYELATVLITWISKRDRGQQLTCMSLCFRFSSNLIIYQGSNVTISIINFCIGATGWVIDPPTLPIQNMSQTKCINCHNHYKCIENSAGP